MRTFHSDFPNGMNLDSKIDGKLTFRSFQELLEYIGSLPWSGIALQTGNTKLNKDLPNHHVIGWSLPANAQYGLNENTCSQAGSCAGICYAKQGSYRFSNVKIRQWLNLAGTFHSEFVPDMIQLLEDHVGYVSRNFPNKKAVIRIHDSGDFLGKGYLQKWFDILNAVPNIFGYAYTKRLDLPLYQGKPDNFHIIQSIGGKLDSTVKMEQPHSRIFSSLQLLEDAGYVDGSETDLPAIVGETKIGLVYHGSRNLTDSQKRFLDNWRKAIS